MKMEREDGYKKDLPTQSLMLTLTFQDISSEIIERLSTIAAQPFFKPYPVLPPKGGGGTRKHVCTTSTQKKILARPLAITVTLSPRLAK